MHHGFYDPAVKKYDHKAAQIEMIDKAVDWCYGKDLSTANPKSVGIQYLFKLNVT